MPEAEDGEMRRVPGLIPEPLTGGGGSTASPFGFAASELAGAIGLGNFRIGHKGFDQ